MAHASLEHLDAAVLRRVLQHRTPGVTHAARRVSVVAEPRFTYPLLLAAGIAGSRRARHAATIQAWQPVLVVAVGAGLRKAVSRWVARPRPPRSDWLIQPDGYSLPSKHTTLAALTAGACARKLAIQATVGRWLPAAAAGIVGTSRVLLGVHWPSDVLAGWLFAEGYLRLVDRLVANE
jgi:membrane-associated phospholipid phosphatase